MATREAPWTRTGVLDGTESPGTWKDRKHAGIISLSNVCLEDHFFITPGQS